MPKHYEQLRSKDRLEELLKVLKKIGFKGNTDNYFDPKNRYCILKLKLICSIITDLIKRRRGIPITLSVLAIHGNNILVWCSPFQWHGDMESNLFLLVCYFCFNFLRFQAFLHIFWFDLFLQKLIALNKFTLIALVTSQLFPWMDAEGCSKWMLLSCRFLRRCWSQLAIDNYGKECYPIFLEYFEVSSS